MGVLKRAETDIPMEVALVGLISKKEASLRCSTKRLCQYEATVSTKQKSTLVASQLGNVTQLDTARDCCFYVCGRAGCCKTSFNVLMIVMDDSVSQLMHDKQSHPVIEQMVKADVRDDLPVSEFDAATSASSSSGQIRLTQNPTQPKEHGEYQ
jgi:hypothetical protein